MRNSVISLVIIICLFSTAQPAVSAEEFTLKNTIKKDLEILENDGHGRDFFVVYRTKHGRHAGNSRINKNNFRELKPFEEIAAIDLRGSIQEDFSFGNLSVKQWTFKSGGISSIRELTYRERNMIRVKQYIIEKESPPYTLSYLSVNGQGLMLLQQDEEIIRVSYEIALSDLGELLQRFEKEAKQCPFPYRTQIFLN
jgi:phage-related protein